MIIKFTIWSPLISLLAIFFLYPLRFHLRGNHISRYYAAILLFPAFVSAFYILFIVNIKQSIISNIMPIMTFPIVWGVQITGQGSALIFSVMCSLAAFIFLFPTKNFANTISSIAISFAFYYIIITTPDQLLKASAFSIGSMLMAHILLSDDDKEQISTDFILHRISDFLSLTSLILILSNQSTAILKSFLITRYNIEDLPRFLYFISTMILVISSHMVPMDRAIQADSSIKSSIFRRIFIGAGSQTLLLFFAPLIFNNDNIDIIFIISSSMIIIYSLLQVVFDHDKGRIIHHAANILIATAFVAICSGFESVAIAIICTLLIGYSLTSLVMINKGSIVSQSYQSIFLPRFLPWATLFSRIFLKIPAQAIYFCTQLFTNFLSPLYSGFLLYRMPQILMGVLQSPLRLMHKGNIQRSMLFGAIIMVSYLYWWAKK